MAVLIDTDVLLDLERAGSAATLERVAPDEQRAISVVTVSELLHGVQRASGAHRARRSAFVEHLLAGMNPVPITEAVARAHAGIWAELAGRGEAIGAHDLWIAATGIAQDLAVATCNAAEFERVPGLRVLDASA